MTNHASTLITVLRQLAEEADTVVEFDARAKDVLEEQLGPELAFEVISGDVPDSPHDQRRELAVDAAPMMSVCRELLGLASDQTQAGFDQARSLQRMAVEVARLGVGHRCRPAGGALVRRALQDPHPPSGCPAAVSRLVHTLSVA